jgi:hypothetical protein
MSEDLPDPVPPVVSAPPHVRQISPDVDHNVTSAVERSQSNSGDAALIEAAEDAVAGALRREALFGLMQNDKAAYAGKPSHTLKFNRTAYMRDYMRRRRALQRIG